MKMEVTMGYSEMEAKELVVNAGKMLVESGLITRTWGNISARISDTQFVITPSGLAYEALTPDQIVIVNIADCAYEGNIKPSSEKGIHADAYRLRPEVNFVIHTHQVKASVISLEGKHIEVKQEIYQKILGEVIPCAAYGISSTKKLRNAVAEAVQKFPGSNAILMKHHGTLCMGNDIANTFEIAETLERLAEEKYDKVCGAITKVSTKIIDYGRSERKGNSFVITCDGKTTEYNLNSMPETVSEVALLHSVIYKYSKVNNILHIVDDDVVEVSRTGHLLRPFLDDLAQIAGVNISNVYISLEKDGPSKRKAVARRLKHKNAVFIADAGALCTGVTESDTFAVGMVLKKGCEADLYAAALNNIKWLGTLDASIQRFIYIKKYSKIKK
jgi:L-fuculose-phosphate aldolase